MGCVGPKMREIPQESWFCSVCVECTSCEKHDKKFEEAASFRLYEDGSTPFISSEGDVKRNLDCIDSTPFRAQRECWGTSLSMCCVCSEDKASRLKVCAALYHHTLVPNDVVVHIFPSLVMRSISMEGIYVMIHVTTAVVTVVICVVIVDVCTDTMCRFEILRCDDKYSFPFNASNP